MDYKLIISITEKLTDLQKELFMKNIDLWNKTASMNARAKHFDSFDIDNCELRDGWHYFSEEIHCLLCNWDNESFVEDFIRYGS